MTAPEPPAVPDVRWSPSENALYVHPCDAADRWVSQPASPRRAASWAVPNLPADARQLVREEDVDDLRLRLWQEHHDARAAGIPRGTIVAAQSVVGNILMNAPESTSLQEIAVAIVDEVAGALAVLPGDAGAAPATGQAREHLAKTIATAIGHTCSYDSGECSMADTTLGCQHEGGHPEEPGCDACGEWGWPCAPAYAAADAVRALLGTDITPEAGRG